jgi:hypothetical protein
MTKRDRINNSYVKLRNCLILYANCELRRKQKLSTDDIGRFPFIVFKYCYIARQTYFMDPYTFINIMINKLENINIKCKCFLQKKKKK